MRWELLAIILALTHFTSPILYYLYLKRKWLQKSWHIKVDKNYKPRVTVIVPAYNEAEFIQKKLANINLQDYPKDLIEIFIVDNASEDETKKVAKDWASIHNKITVRLLEEKKKGKLFALLKALNYISSDSEVVVFTDVDALWELNALKETVKYLADPTVGSITSSVIYGDKKLFENVYRNYYNEVRIAESKVYSTPIHNGPFQAVKTELLRKMGLPVFAGSDDSAFGSYIAFSGLRAIQVDDVIAKEHIRGGTIQAKLRRAHTLLSTFFKTKRYAIKMGFYKYNRLFEKIWKIEWWLHVINPWLLVAAIIFLVSAIARGSFAGSTLLGIGLSLLVAKRYRMWMLQQLCLTIAAIRNLYLKEPMWER